MENVVEALIMAGQMLMFIIALTVCISSFTTLRVNVDEIMGHSQTVQMSKDDNGYINYINSENAKATRLVGAETVVSSMYRAAKENYVIYIVADSCEALAGYGSNAVDLYAATQNFDIGSKRVITMGKKIIKVTIGIETNQDINNKLSNGFYDKISGLSFFEYLGEYQNESLVTSENKQTYRVITYVEKNYMENCPDIY